MNNIINVCNSYKFNCSLNDDPRLRPYVGNGHIATVIKNDLIHMNGFYNGHMTKSTRAIIPSTCDINITGTSPDYQFSRKYVLNAAEGNPKPCSYK